MTNGTLYLRYDSVHKQQFYLSSITRISFQMAEREQDTDNPRVYFSKHHPEYFVPEGQEEWFRTPIEAKQAGTNAGFDVVEDLMLDYWYGIRNIEEARADSRACPICAEQRANVDANADGDPYSSKWAFKAIGFGCLAGLVIAVVILIGRS